MCKSISCIKNVSFAIIKNRETDCGLMKNVCLETVAPQQIKVKRGGYIGNEERRFRDRRTEGTQSGR